MREKLDELLLKISMLQQAEQNHALSQENVKVSQLKTVSYDAVNSIYIEIETLYRQSKHNDKLPAFNEGIIFNDVFMDHLTMHACYAFYLYAKTIPEQHDQLEDYLLLAEQKGFTGIRLIEFYKNYSHELCSAKNNNEIESLYNTSRTLVKQEFDFNTGKGRLLDLLMVVHTVTIIRSRSNEITTRFLSAYVEKANATLRIFTRLLKNDEIKSEVTSFFATGALLPTYSTYEQLVIKINEVLLTYPQQQQSSKRSLFQL